MAERMAQSQKGKEKAETSRAVWSENMKKIFLDLCIEEVLQGGRPGSNFKAQSWTKIIEGFKVKTGLLYEQKQLKNQWDLMIKQYNAWTTLCGQTGVGYNEATQTITMEPERWDEYLKGHPDAKIFRTTSLSFPNEMTTLFGGTQARGEDAWTPSSGSIPEDLNMQMASLLLDISNTQNAVEQEPYLDVEMEELMLMSNVRRKRPGPS
eukprot:TRINITY_DN4641_c0_g1_i14.p1 TRINITY_DN4641_c0_g1~~TRINITY_DN4641_c0_g1_i14.p1  ORF type:complete len:208 (-),score=34.06 TRINITY_DN4641_c0_g1_i14:232-855(-)